MLRYCIYTLTLLLGLVSPILAQTPTVAIQGKLLGSTSKRPIDFSNVLLLSPADSSLVTGAVSDASGSFQLSAPSGDYILQIKGLSHQTYTKTLSVPTSSATLDLGTIALTEESVQLQAVTVSAKRPIITRKADRLVFDAEQLSLGAQSALDVLKQTPGLSVSDDGISVIGKGNVIVLINDKRVRLSGKALVSLLRSYTSRDLGQVEVITTPPAKYEAEGNAGILNIVLKKSKNDFFGGSISAGYQLVQDKSSGNLSGNLNYKRGKTTASLTAGYGTWTYASGFSTEKIYPSTQRSSFSETRYVGKSKGPNLRATFDYDLRPDLSFGLSCSYSPDGGTLSRDNNTRDYDLPAKALRQYALGTDLEKTNSGYLTANLHLEKAFMSHPGRKLSWDVDYVSSDSKTDDDFRAESFTPLNVLIPGSAFVYSSHGTKQANSVLTNIDFVLPIGKAQTSFGVKGTWSHTNNLLHYKQHTEPLLNGRREEVSFDEHIYAFYADASLPLSDKWTSRAGVRLEYTHNAGELNGVGRLNLKDYLNVFPTLYLGFTPSERHAFSLDGTVRLERPGFFQLSPFPRYENQYTIMKGREDLRASKQGSLNLGYTFGGKLNFSAFGKYRWDGLTQFISLDAVTNQAQYLWGNNETEYAWGLSNNYYFTSLSFLQAYLNQSVQYTQSKVRNEEGKGWDNDGLSYMASVNTTLFFNRSKTFTGNINVSYSTPRVENGFKMESMFNTSVGLAYALCQGKLKLSANVYNLFNRDFTASTITGGNKITARNFASPKFFNLGLTYSFGAPIQGKREHGNANEVRSRM